MNKYKYLKPERKEQFKHVGEHVGMLTLLGVVEKRVYGKSRIQHLKYHCHCDCGNEVVMFDTAIFSSPAPSCGCLMWKNKVPVRKDGTFNDLGEKRILGPWLKNWRTNYQKHNMKDEEVQVKAQISRCIGRIINNQSMFKTHEGSRLNKAVNTIRRYSRWHIKEMVRVFGLQGAIDRLYEDL